MLYGAEDFQLMLVNHGRSFSTSNDRPTYLGNTGLTIGREWRRALLEIDDKKLRKELEDVLDKKRLAALAGRRDALIADAKR